MCALVADVPTLGEIVREFREARNLSQAIFSRRAGVNPSTIYNIEKDRTGFAQNSR